MQELFDYLEAPDYTFLAEVLYSPFNVNPDRKLIELAREYDASGSPEVLERLRETLERSIRYLGSADIAFNVRKLQSGEGGLPIRTVVEDVARRLGVRVSRTAPLDIMVADVTSGYATVAFARMDRSEQQRMLEELGVASEQAARFVGRSAGVFALPVAVQAFSAIVVEGLIKRVIFGTIARYIGEKLASQLFALLAGRLPWWVNWVGPAAWAGSLGWTAFDLQGPAYRKTIPAVLYLGLCVIRERGLEVNSYGR